MFQVILPRLDPGMKEGVIVVWLKKEGDSVNKGDAIAKVEGEKVIFDVQTSKSGILGKILIPQGKSVPIATPIAIITQPGEEIPKIEQEAPKEAEVAKPVSRRAVKAIPTQEALPKQVRASPLARRLAKEKNIDLTKVKGSGPGGRIEKEDVLKFEEEMAKAPLLEPQLETVEIIPLVGMRKTIAERMTQSYQGAPQLAISMEVNMSEALKVQDKLEKISGIKIPFTSFLTKIVAYSMEKFPILNSSIVGDEIQVYRNINMGIAVAVEEGLIVPVVLNVERKGILEIAKNVRELIEKAKKRQLSADELKGGTFTITNLGGYGVDVFEPIINPPQAAILATGKITEKPVVIEGEIKIALIMTLTLVFDHRILDGAKAALFLQDIKKTIEEPYNLLVP